MKKSSIKNIPANNSSAAHQINILCACRNKSPVQKTENKIPCRKLRFIFSKEFSVFVTLLLSRSKIKLKIPLRAKNKIKKNKALPGTPDDSGSI